MASSAKSATRTANTNAGATRWTGDTKGIPKRILASSNSVAELKRNLAAGGYEKVRGTQLPTLVKTPGGQTKAAPTAKKAAAKKAPAKKVTAKKAPAKKAPAKKAAASTRRAATKA